MRRGSWLLALLVSLVQLSCQRSNPAPAFITSPGRFRYFDDALRIEVGEAPEGKIDYRISRSKVSVGRASAPIRCESKWFIHPATENSVWVYDGEDELLLIQMDANGDSKFTSSKVVTDLTNRAPPEVIERLNSFPGRDNGK